MVKCPRCQSDVEELRAVDPQIVTKLQESGESGIPAQVCANCLAGLSRVASKPSEGVLVAQERAKEQRRIQMWKSRVQLIKQGRACMTEKNYSEAAVSYEKYLKILEMVFGCKKGEKLSPEHFKDNARTSELTIVASVYWDLLRIYDSSDRYADRQKIAADQLAAFVRFTPIFPDIMRKAAAFQKQAKNPAVIKQFLRGASEQRPRCFIATCVFETPFAPEVQILRHFRDQRMRQSWAGRAFIRLYEELSPRIVPLIDKAPALKAPLRAVLRRLSQAIG